MHLGIYVPGLGYGIGSITLSSYVKAFSESLERNDENKYYEYSVKLEKRAFKSDEGKQEFDTATIYKKLPGDDSSEQTLYRFYEYNYEEDFTERINNTNIFGKSLRLFWGIVKMAPVFLFTLIAKGLSRKQKLQSLYFFLILVLISFFTALILPSLVAIFLDNFKDARAYIAAATLQYPYLHTLTIDYKNFSHLLVVVTSAGAILYPNFQKAISTAATEYLCVHYYLKYGEGKHALTGGLVNMVEKISQTEKEYESFEIHAYSFGSIIAIDTLYPKLPQQVDLRISNEITGMVTVGCPFDFIRVYYPYYFKKREKVHNHVDNWYNVNCELDVLSSNFRNDSDLQDGLTEVAPGGMAVKNISYDITEVKNIGWIDYLFLLSFRTHRMYWSENPREISFFSNYINRMKKDKASASVV